MSELNQLNDQTNFYNVINRQFEYIERNSNVDRVVLQQQMAECGLGVDVPTYLL